AAQLALEPGLRPGPRLRPEEHLPRQLRRPARQRHDDRPHALQPRRGAADPIGSARPLRYTRVMRIRTLGRSGLRVSEICLGAMTFGMPEWGCDERESLGLIE